MPHINSAPRLRDRRRPTSATRMTPPPPSIIGNAASDKPSSGSHHSRTDLQVLPHTREGGVAVADMAIGDLHILSRPLPFKAQFVPKALRFHRNLAATGKAHFETQRKPSSVDPFPIAPMRQ
ncbi:uncharacterized protein [Triticum aestivum]|uniref:uncharacterized protein n=1 Tax=Triticum aestivum TaxID=4565 RepID=UPI001D00383A|nr:uncharacterized protein LOC123181960 [Triticum aestivum]